MIEKACAQFRTLLQQQLARIEGMESCSVEFFPEKTVTIGLVDGDGIGPVIMESAEAVLRKLLADEIRTGKVILKKISLTLEARLEAGVSVPDLVMEQIKTCDVLLKGPTTTPMGGKMESANAAQLDNPKYSKSCVNYYITLKAGTITSIDGIEEVEQMPQVLQNATFKKIGDTIEQSNNLDRVIYRLHVMDDTPEKLAKTLETISHTLHILDEKGEEMQLEVLTYERALEMLLNS